MKSFEIVAGGTTYRMELPDADHDYIQKTIATTQRPYEEAMLIDIADVVVAGDLVLDVGANCGNHTLYLSCVVGAEVHAFEPDGELCSAIRSSASLNAVENLVTVHEVGVGDAEGFGRLVQTAENNRGAQRLQRVSSEENGTTIIRLDDIEFSKPVRAMKIDVEGMELDVLNGAKSIIEQNRPEIYVECQTRQDFERIHTWLAQFGYRYLSTFNATPTHHFGPNSSADGSDRFEQIVKQQVAATYYDQQLIAQLRKNLTEANLKYRGATAQLAPLNEQLRLITASDARQGELVLKLEQQLLELEQQIREMDLSAEQTSTYVQELQSKLADTARVENKLTERAKTLSAVHKELRENLRRERNRVEAVEKQIAQTNASKLELESRIAEQTQQRRDEQHSMRLELESTLSRLSRMRRKAKLNAAKANAAQTQSTIKAAQLADMATQLSAVEALLAQANEEVEDRSRRITIEKGMVSRLERALGESKRQAASLQSEVGEAKTEISLLRDSESELQKLLTASNEESSSLGEEARKAKTQITKLQEVLKRTQTELSAAEEKSRALRASVTFRLGQVLRDSAKSPGALITLPLALGRLAAEHRRRTVVSGIVVAESSTEGQTGTRLKQLSAPINRAAELRDSRRLPESHETAALQLTGEVKKSKTRVAAIMDDFTVQSFAPECELLELSLDDYVNELNSFSPSLVFLESAWRGKNDAWGNKVAQTAVEVRAIISWANTNNVPVVLWNKEDPVHYSTFLNTAKLVDYVFTTDVDCVQRYKSDLGHDRVSFLPFACQPVLHNPLEVYNRSEGFCFAGAYYRRYPARTKDLESFMAEIPRFAPLEIFDRNFGKTDEQYKFPEDYQDYIVGTLNSSEIDLAYKGYDYAINLNSVKESQSMFARRVFELLASNTTVVSNYSRGLQLMFGEIPVLADSGRVVVKTLSSSDAAYDGRRRKLAGLRKVMLEHTYSRRLNDILSRTGLRTESDQEPIVEVFSLVSSRAEVRAIQTEVQRQVGVHVLLHLYSENVAWVGAEGIVEGLPVAKLSDSTELSLNGLIGAGNFAAVMVPSDFYGANYLLDLALAARYSSAVVVGKASFFQAKGRGVVFKDAGLPYTATRQLPVRSSLVTQPEALEINVSAWLRGAPVDSFEYSSMLTTEVFDYCRNGAALATDILSTVTSGHFDVGLSLDDLVGASDQIEATNFIPDADCAMTGAELAELFVTRSRPGVLTSLRGDLWHFESTLEDGAHDYLYASKLVSLDTVVKNGKLEFHVEADPGLNLQVAIIYYDDAGTKLVGIVRAANQNHTLDVPENAVSVKIGVRIFASGESSLRRILWTHKNIKPAFVAARAENLVITNRYPSYEDLYRNGFVHSRVLRYIQAGVPTEVFVLNENSHLRFREFEGVTVITGSSAALDTLLVAGSHRSISLHFINESMWEAVASLPQKPRIAIWAHGADIQKWSRREFLYKTDEEIEAAKATSDRRLALWRRIFDEASPSVRVIFVSSWLAETAMADLNLEERESRSVVIHNPIDTTKFKYRKKTAEQRLKVLSIRPYASSVYANDLTVDAILVLSGMPHFEDMEFRLVGDGPLFDEVTEPLRKFPNVILDKRFLTQDEIAEMHKDYGVFLCPSRMDTQGVSRDEAMASGLVPVTTNVAAIPEFADDSCAELVEPENAAEIAAALTRLAKSSRSFRRKSAAAAKRVRLQTAASKVIPYELEILGY